MGIPIDPPEYGNDCALCFPVGETPKYLYVTFSEIIGGQFFVPGISPPPPNGTWKLQQHGGCVWDFQDADVTIEYVVAPGFSALELFVLGVDFGMSEASPTECVYTWEGNPDPTAKVYCAGKAQIMFVENPASPYSLRTIADLMGIPLDSQVLAEFWPLSEFNLVPMFASYRWPGRIHLKIDFTHWDQYDMFER